MLMILLMMSCRDTRGLNRAPSLSAVWLTPPAPTASDRIRAVTSAEDPDGDSLSFQVTWEINGLRVEGESVLDPAWLSKGDRVTALVVPWDGRDVGNAVATSPVLVVNSPPSLSGVTLSPAAPIRGTDDLRCEADAEPVDIDGDPVTLRWLWLIDGVKLTDADGNEYDDEEIPGAWTAGDEVWQCTARISDGEDTRDVSAEVTIGWPTDITPLSEAIAFPGASSGDQSGSALLGVGDIDGDGAGDLLIGADLNDTGGDPNGGAAWLLTDLTGGELTETGRILGEAAYDRLGASMASAGPGRFALGAWASGRTDNNAGAVFVMTGATPLDTAPLIVLGGAKNDYAGTGLSYAGDTDGDGVAELVIGAPGEDSGGSEAGAVWLTDATAEGVVTLEDADAIAVGTAAGEGLGTTVAGIGDADGDGLDDVLIGAPDVGAVVLWTASGTRRWESEGLGGALAGVGDVDGDGRTDVLLGAPDALDGAGRVLLYSGADGAYLKEWIGEVGDGLGAALVATDGAIFVGSPGLEGTGGVLRIDPNSGETVQTWVGLGADDLAGSALSLLDGALLIGAPGADDSGGNSGTTYLLPW
ncbi:MAG: hypothetical protein ACI8RZ_000837 [Myxococcota bacterium]|jgi:hypothetical protein